MRPVQDRQPAAVVQLGPTPQSVLVRVTDSECCLLEERSNHCALTIRAMVPMSVVGPEVRGVSS